jgi:hypothetical protein
MRADTTNTPQTAVDLARQDSPAPPKHATPRRATLGSATFIPAGEPASRHTLQHTFPFYADARFGVGYYAETRYS